MANSRLYRVLGLAHRSAAHGSAPQNETKHGGNIFATSIAMQASLRGFLRAMSGVSLGAARAIAQKFPWADYRTFIDIGAAQGALPVQVGAAHPHLTGGGFDLPPVRPVFEEFVAAHGLQDVCGFIRATFSRTPCPTADVLVMGHILHDWDLARRSWLLGKATRRCRRGRGIVYDA